MSKRQVRMGWHVEHLLNGDGKLDLVSANQGSNTISVLLGNGDGSFQSPVNLAVGGAPAGLYAPARRLLLRGLFRRPPARRP